MVVVGVALLLDACAINDDSIPASHSVVGCPPPAGDRPWLDASYTPDCRAEFVLATLPSLDLKLAFLEGGGFGALPSFAELGLETGTTQDGPAGFDGGTAWPTPLTIAASFDTDLAQRYGEALGREFHDSGRSGILGPAFDSTRVWRFGRSTESFGEDPYLSARLAAREVHGIQSQHVLVTMKHYAAYTQEQGRLGDNPIGERPAVDQIVSERALRQIYLPAFEAAVVEGGAGGVMCSFPRINGTYACEHEELLTGILKNEWGFDGAVAPDFPVAQRSIARAFAAGLDGGTLSPSVTAGGSAGPNRFAGELSLRDAIAQGLVTERRLDDMIRRRLVPGFRIGMFDHPARAVREEPSTREARALAAEIVQAGAVLLKNNGVLPLGPTARRVAVVGTQAGDDAVVVEQGSPYVEPRHFVSAAAGLRERVGSAVEVLYEPGGIGLGGLPAPPIAALRSPSGEPGLLAEYYASPDIALRGAPVASRNERTVDVNGAPGVAGLPPNKRWSARWRAELVAAESGRQRLTLEGSGSAELWVAGKLRDAFYNSDFGSRLYGSIDLDAGSTAPIEIRYSPRVTLGDAPRAQFNTVLGTVLRLGYAGPDALEARAVAAAASSDVALVFAGHIVGEGWDRHSLNLPAEQNELIAAVAAANPRTVVILVTGGPVAMPWLDDVAAVLQVWLPGDAFGPALAGLIYGDADPGGRLPVTFPAAETQGPGATRGTYPGTTTADGALDTVRFDEDLAIGYRYYDSFGQIPLFPFGHGLSYATFALDDIGARAQADGGAEVRARVKNTSSRAGSEVVQVYVGFPASAGEPPRQLKGFVKVRLEAGESRDVVIPLAARAFQVWDSQADTWSTPSGQFSIFVGRSSRDFAYTTILAPTR